MIHIIFTGGTIGCRIKESGTLDLRDTSYELLSMYEERLKGSGTAFSVSEPYRILSEDLSAAHLLKLIAEIKRVIMEKPDGIIITHGTDTLQYTAAILSYIFGSSAVPIVLVSANRVLSDESSNGFTNFVCAVRFIEEVIKGKRGVFVAYDNGGESTYIHRGNRLGDPIPFSDYVYSIRDQYFGRYEKIKGEYGPGRFLANYDYIEHNDMDTMFWFHDDVYLLPQSDRILRLTTFPGICYPEILGHVSAILLSGYHSGTAGPGNELADFVERAVKREIPVYLTGVSEYAAEYESMTRLFSLGVMPLRDLSPIGQYCKLWLALSNGLDVRKTMDTVYAGEK